MLRAAAGRGNQLWPVRDTARRIFELARREEWVLVNPCSLVDNPRSAETDTDIHFLELEEVEALLRAVPDDGLGRVERPMYLRPR